MLTKCSWFFFNFLLNISSFLPSLPLSLTLRFLPPSLSFPFSISFCLPSLPSSFHFFLLFLPSPPPPPPHYLLLPSLSSTECPVGTFSDTVSNSTCQSCPANSEATQPGLTACPCVQTYYRAPYEGAGEPCTRECNS